MMQLHTPLARNTDAQTSHDAAGKARTFKARHIAIIYDMLFVWGALTPREIANRGNLDYHAVQRRGAEMERKGLIARGPDKRDGQLVWGIKC
jgi:DNA-binding MarR family transcriptional regulator